MFRKIISAFLIAVLLATLSSCALLRSVDESASVDTTEKITEENKTEGANVTESDTEPPETSPMYSVPVKRPGDPFTVCIDPGHGYVDPGSTSDHLGGKWEREIVREYAEKLKSELEAEGVRVIMLWDEDVYVTAAEVAEAAKAAGVKFAEEKLVDDRRFAAYNRSVWANVLHRETYIDAFVSLHVNTYTADESVWGTRIYYCTETENEAASGKLCTSISGAIGNSLPSQKVRYYADKAEDAYVVTKVPEMASVLVEIGFVTNEAEAKNILDEKWSDSFVDGLCRGILACKS
ncbi:MAG: N-acetylmuramoyl-L-alanine amidase [Clostridia bacterium]|nr:N-acetylmuramoyl-L-alanine amidase [Clostridia bacterium]